MECYVEPATHLAILYPDRSEFDRRWKSLPADTPGDFFVDRDSVELQGDVFKLRQPM